jgi:hypothetical protein
LMGGVVSCCIMSLMGGVVSCCIMLYHVVDGRSCIMSYHVVDGRSCISCFGSNILPNVILALFACLCLYVHHMLACLLACLLPEAPPCLTAILILPLSPFKGVRVYEYVFILSVAECLYQARLVCLWGWLYQPVSSVCKHLGASCICSNTYSITVTAFNCYR